MSGLAGTLGGIWPSNLLQQALALLLLMLLSLMFFYLLQLGDQRLARMRMLHSGGISSPDMSGRFFYRPYRRLLRNLQPMLETLGWSMSASGFVRLSLFLALSGAVAGGLFYDSPKGGAVSLLLLGGLPYLVLRMRLVSAQLRVRSEFLPALEVFYQSYVLFAGRNLRSVFQHVTTQERLDPIVHGAYAQLQRNLAMNRPTDEALHVFQLSFGHVWAGYFVNLIRIGLEEGIDLSDSLRQLIQEMRQVQLNDQVERNKLLEIRLANFTPLFFLLLFITINFRLSPESAWHYYFIDAVGKNMLLDALLLIFLSFVMGVILSMKRL